MLQEISHAVLVVCFFFTSVAFISPPPIELTEIIAYAPTQNSVELRWCTSYEEDFDRFEVERSTNGVDFVTVGFVKAAGNSNTGEIYSFLDTNPNNPDAKYRLKQIDMDGTHTYSEAVGVGRK